MITGKEIGIARRCMEYALEKGADSVRVSLGKSVLDSLTMLNGELDKVSRSADRSVFMYLFVDGRYGTFSTNRLDEKELEDFVGKAVDMVRMLGEDGYRCLPDPERTAKDAKSGNELGLFDERYSGRDAGMRLEAAGKLSIYGRLKQEEAGKGYTLVSEECEYSESYDDNYLIDSNGFEGRHTESSFGCFSEMTIQDTEGVKYSGFWWDSSCRADGPDILSCGRKALERAVRQIGPKKRRSGRYRMVVDAGVASRLVAPLLSALNASAIQQNMSFLEGSAGKKIFSEGLTIMDMARTPGKNGSRLFDTEGVATEDSPVIKDGIVQKYFVSTYLSRKMGIPATIEDISRPCLMPFLKGEGPIMPGQEIPLEDILHRCGSGILVTGFNGGNCNPVSGDFSFGIEGFAFSRGKILHPVREMLVTGDMTGLWNSLMAAGTDALPSSRWQIPSLAFEDVSFSA